MKAKQRFPNDVLSAIRKGMVIGLRAGTQPHRFIGLWAVVVEGRVFVRSWSLKPSSWYRTFLEEPRGTIQVVGDEFAVRAVHTRSERLKHWSTVLTSRSTILQRRSSSPETSDARNPRLRPRSSWPR